jgi:hypothetical protein
MWSTIPLNVHPEVAGQKVIGKKTAEMIVKRFMTCDCVRLADGSFLPSMQGEGNMVKTREQLSLVSYAECLFFPGCDIIETILRNDAPNATNGRIVGGSK